VNLQRTGEPVRLIRVGAQVPEELGHHVRFLAASGAFVSLPFLSRDVLAALYRRATLLMQTSDAEGFALPMAEAMACGLTVAASDLPVLREVGGSAAHYCPAGDVTAWTDMVEAVLRDQSCAPADAALRRRQANLQQASRFSLEAHVSGNLRVYEELTGSAWTEPARSARVSGSL
jgi:glycosyltransferase involved in cell wall biosynthesis